MDDRTFDSLIRSLSAATVERRQTIKRLLGAALGLSLGQIALADADARKKKKRKKKRKKKTPSPPACTPQCDGKACGDDGCGESCGNCDDGYSCTDTANGSTCQPGVCTPNCAGKDCGPNGCGGTCGACQGHETCTGGGVCQCTPNCAGKTCGSNGCGGSCGSCPEGQTCNGSTCQCASGNCGGSCCAGNQTCISGECWPDSEESAFVTSINNHRAAHGLGPLGLQNQLGRAAVLHSQDQAAHGFFDHTGSDGSDPNERIAAAGYSYSYWGENIYYGGGTASDAFTWWKGSDGHNANMLSTTFTQFGIGRSFRGANGYWYWTTTFGKPA